MRNGGKDDTSADDYMAAPYRKSGSAFPKSGLSGPFLGCCGPRLHHFAVGSLNGSPSGASQVHISLDEFFEPI
jgi:hypothetical protein